MEHLWNVCGRFLMRVSDMNQEKKIITPDEFKTNLKKEGLTLKQWAEQRNFDPNYASRVLNGMVKGNRGIGHKIAVEMGLK